MHLFKSRNSIDKLSKNGLYQDFLKDPGTPGLRKALVVDLEKNKHPLAMLIRSQAVLDDSGGTKPQFAEAFRSQWLFYRDHANDILSRNSDLVWDWPWPELTWSNMDNIHRPCFGEQVIPGVLWQYDHGFPNTLGISAKELANRGEKIFALYPIRRLAVSSVTSEAMLAARDERGVLYETCEEWGRLEDVVQFPGLQQITGLSISGAHLEIADVEMLASNSKLARVENLTLMVAPTAFADACHLIANSKQLKSLRSLEMCYKPHHEPDSMSTAITDDVLIELAESDLPHLEEVFLWGESLRMHDPISDRGITALLDADRFTGISLTTSNLNDNTLELVGNHSCSNRLKKLRLSWGTFSKQGIEGLTRHNNWENLECLDLFIPASLVNFDLRPFAECGSFPNLRRFHARNLEIDPKTVAQISKGLPRLRQLILSQPFTADTDPSKAAEIFEQLEFLQMPLGVQKHAELLANARIFELLPAFKTSIAYRSDTLEKVVNGHTASQLAYLDFTLNGLNDNGQRSLDHSGSFAHEFIESCVGQNLLVVLDDSDFAHPAFEKRWGRMYFHEPTQREIRRNAFRQVPGKPNLLFQWLTRLGIIEQNYS